MSVHSIISKYPEPNYGVITINGSIYNRPIPPSVISAYQLMVKNITVPNISDFKPLLMGKNEWRIGRTKSVTPEEGKAVTEVLYTYDSVEVFDSLKEATKALHEGNWHRNMDLQLIEEVQQMKELSVVKACGEGNYWIAQETSNRGYNGFNFVFNLLGPYNNEDEANSVLDLLMESDKVNERKIVTRV